MKYAKAITRISLKRVYDPPSAKDGFRVLVGRLWPRGLKKENTKIDLWCKDVAPGNDLRKWFGHDPAKWDEFERRYFRELDNHPAETSVLAEKAKSGAVTLLFAAKDKIYNNAAALIEYIEKTTNK
jgi:uncharacterized protein YeaO (DUF488 family)